MLNSTFIVRWKKFHTRGTKLYPKEWDMLFKLIHDSLNPFTTTGIGSFSVKKIF